MFRFGVVRALPAKAFEAGTLFAAGAEESSCELGF
jgi:hypothetical protein